VPVRDFIGHLARELWTELQTRCKCFHIKTASFIVNSHPPAGFPPGRKLTRFAGRAFEQGKHVFAKLAAVLIVSFSQSAPGFVRDRTGPRLRKRVNGQIAHSGRQFNRNILSPLI
jgi:hypothetical protein